MTWTASTPATRGYRRLSSATTCASAIPKTERKANPGSSRSGHGQRPTELADHRSLMPAIRTFFDEWPRYQNREGRRSSIGYIAKQERLRQTLDTLDSSPQIAAGPWPSLTGQLLHTF